MDTLTVTLAADKRPGDVWWQPVQEILDYWFSVDRAMPASYTGSPGACGWTFEPWPSIMHNKRNDYQYKDVRESLAENGFLGPLNAIVNIRKDTWLGDRFPDKYPYPTFGDGHHRFTAAVDIGLSHVLMCASDSQIVHHDEGWSRHHKIPKHP